MISRLMNYTPAILVAAFFTWFSVREIRRIIRSRTDVSRMRGEITAEQTGLTGWEQEQWELIMAGNPDLMLKGRLSGPPAGRRDGRRL